MLTLAALRAKPHTSLSQLKAFIQCPRKYFIQYIKGALPAFRPLALVFGSAWHETVAEHLTRSRRDRQVAVDELRAHLRDGLVRGLDRDDVPVLFEEDEQDIGTVIDVAMRMLDAFLARVPVPDQVHGVEVPFRLKLAHPVTGEIHPVPLVGAIDAIVEDRGQPVVWELKTGKKRWSADQLDFDLQPTAYGMAARTLGYKDARLTLLVTTKGKTPDVQVEQVVRHRRDELELVETAPGVYDIHSPRVPTVEEMFDLLARAVRVLPPNQLWVNPDCGLKTRGWTEVELALTRMVEAARLARLQLAQVP